MTDEEAQRRDFRDRLNDIPKIEEQPPPQHWDTAAPPVVRRAAPVARPQPAPGIAAEQPLAHGGSDGVDHVDPVTNDMVDPVGPRKRRKWPLILFVLFALAALAVIVPLYRVRQVFNNVERVQVSDVLTPPLAAGTNILLVGTDSRDGITAETDNAGLIIGGDPITGERTDTIMILRLQEDGSAKFLSLPRDLWLPINGGDPQRINTAFRNGPESLINTVQSELNVPVSHYVQVDLAGFIDLVDAVGGVEVDFEYPSFDRGSGLDIPVAGPNTLDSTQALAYVRSRFFVEIVDGAERRDGTSDIGRVQRQQAFMRALMNKLSTQRNPLVIDRMATAMADAIILDDGTSFNQALDIANTLRSTTPESVVLPTRNATVGGRSVLELTSEAPAVLAQFAG